jgi:hypothetical protein
LKTSKGLPAPGITATLGPGGFVAQADSVASKAMAKNVLFIMSTQTFNKLINRDSTLKLLI